MTAGTKVTIAMVVLAAAVASANPADVAFKKGRDLLKAGKYAEACEQFQKSEDLDPQLGTQFNIATCSEKIGKLATALAIYHELEAKDTNPARKTIEIDRVADLERRVPRLLIKMVNPPRGIKVTAGEVPLEPNVASMVDPGPYPITVTAPGFRDYATHLTAVESRTASVSVKLVPASGDVAVQAPAIKATKSTEPAKPVPGDGDKPESDKPAKPVEATDASADAKPAKPIEPPAASDAHPNGQRRTYAIYAFAGGGAGIATALVFGLLARSKWDDAQAACGNSTTCTTPESLAEATSLRHSAVTRATAATAFFVVGAAAGAVGGWLWWTSRDEHAVTVTPAAGPDGAGVTLSGRF